MKESNPEANGPKEPQTTKLTVPQSIFSGSVSGACEVLVNHPLWSIKTQMQNGEALTFNPRVLYRGFPLNMASMAPITAVQVGLDRCFQNLFSEQSSGMRFTSTFAAGVGSAFISCPTEMIMTDQKKDGVSFHASAQRLLNQGGVERLYTGLLATALREGFFSAFVFGVRPVLKGELKPYCPNDYVASLTAGIGAGVLATGLSQGLDTLKTIQQSSPKPSSFGNTFKKLYSSEGVYGFFKGSIPRGARVISAVTLMGYVNDKIEEALCQKKDDESRASVKNC